MTVRELQVLLNDIGPDEEVRIVVHADKLLKMLADFAAETDQELTADIEDIEWNTAEKVHLLVIS